MVKLISKNDDDNLIRTVWVLDISAMPKAESGGQMTVRDEGEDGAERESSEAVSAVLALY